MHALQTMNAFTMFFFSTPSTTRKTGNNHQCTLLFYGT